MQERNLFEYAVVRVVPRVEREEFLNVGVILYCKRENFLKVKISIDQSRIAALCGSTDCEELMAHLNAFEQITAGGGDSGPIGQLDAASRFRWLTAQRSTIVQTSKVHPGLCVNAALELEKLHRDMVL